MTNVFGTAVDSIYIVYQIIIKFITVKTSNAFVIN